MAKKLDISKCSCGSEGMVVQSNQCKARYFVFCGGMCDLFGPLRSTPELAVKAWNTERLRELEENEENEEY